MDASPPASLTDNYVYEVCSIASSTETADNLPGAGRILGLVYSAAGRKLERALGSAAERMGYGPRVTALRIKAVSEDTRIPASAQRKKLQKYCKRLGRYTKSSVTSTQEQALERILDLAVEKRDVCEIFRVTAGQTVATLCKNPHIWCDMKSSVPRRARQALAALDDSRIGWLVETLPSLPYYDHRQLLLAELTDYLLHEEYSFLVLRHIHSRIRASRSHGSLFGIIYELIKTLAHKLEGVEWPVFDEVVHWLVGIDLGFFSFAFDMIVIHVEKLPRTVELLKTSVEDANSTNLYLRVRCYIIVYIMSSGSVRSHYTTHVHPSLRTVLMIMGSEPDIALATICGRDEYRNADSNSAIRTATEQLSRCIDSDDEFTRHRSLDAVRTVLSLSRYARQDVLEALASTVLSRTTQYETLVAETAEMCIPKDFSCRQSNLDFCMDHGFHKRTYYRHCGEKGELVHIVDDMCSGECGAVEEHVLELTTDDIMNVRIDPRKTFQSTGHHPLVAGHTRSGKPLYILEMSVASWYSRSYNLAIPDGLQWKELKTRVHYEDGSTSLPTDFPQWFPALKFDPSAYRKSKHYAAQENDEGGMDPTGPFAWTFHRKLSNAQPPAQLSALEASIRATDDVAWRELYIPDAEDDDL